MLCALAILWNVRSLSKKAMLTAGVLMRQAREREVQQKADAERRAALTQRASMQVLPLPSSRHEMQAMCSHAAAHSVPQYCDVLIAMRLC